MAAGLLLGWREPRATRCGLDHVYDFGSEEWWLKVRCPGLFSSADISGSPCVARTLTCLLLLALSACASALAQDGQHSFSKSLDSLLKSRFNATKCPGLTVAVATNNKIVFSRALGMADLEQNVPLTTASVHRLASLSKSIAGAIIMDLVEQGKLSLDTSIRKYLPELPASFEKVTVRCLLDHQSGVRGFPNEADSAFSVAHYATSREAMKTFMDFPLAFEPGTKTEYSSLSFTVLGAAAESVTGRSFQQLSAEFFCAACDRRLFSG
jgi:CubicO group peptidase (beta-lactamase class C family)